MNSFQLSAQGYGPATMGRPGAERSEFRRQAMPLKLLRQYQRSLKRLNGPPGYTQPGPGGRLAGPGSRNSRA